MVDIGVKHAQKEFFLFALEGLDDEFAVEREKEERPTLSSSLTGLKHLVLIVVDV